MAKNARKSAPPAAQKSPLDWKAYFRRVDESAASAEHHLQVPAGTISSIPHDPDFIATVKAYAVVEPLLNDLIVTWSQKGAVLGFGSSAPLPHENEAFRSFVAVLPMSGNIGKLKLAEGLGLLSRDDVSFIQALATIRNRYAHNVRNMHRPLAEMLTEEQQHNGKIVGQLTGLQHKLPLGALSLGDIQIVLKSLMYQRLADYLARALNTLKPPPPPPGGILGAFFEKETTDKGGTGDRS
jgi:hypothetical protein